MKELTVEEHVQLLRDIGRLVTNTEGGISLPDKHVKSLRAIRDLIFDRAGMDFEEKT